MTVSNITDENIEEYSDLIDGDIAENIGRKYFRASAVTNKADEVGAVMVWEYKNTGDDKDPEAELSWLSLKDNECTRELFNAFRKDIVEEAVARTYFELEDPKDKLSDVFSKLKFKTTKRESRDIYTTVGELAGNKIAAKKAPSYIMSISDISYREFRQGIIGCLYNGKKGMVEDLSTLSMDWYEPELSCVVKTDDELTGFLLIHKFPSGVLMPLLFYAGGPNYRMDLLDMMRFSVRKAASIYPAETKVLIRRHNDAVRALSDKLFPGVQGEEILFGERPER